MTTRPPPSSSNAIDEALPQSTEGAAGLRDAITAQDAAGISSATKTLSAGLASYGDVRPILAPLVEQVVPDQRLLVK